MAEPSETKLNPSAEQTSTTEPTLAKEETEKLTTGVTESSETQKPVSFADLASNAAAGVKDNVFAMFGGGAKKEKREEKDDADEPSGSSKNKAADVSGRFFFCSFDLRPYVWGNTASGLE